MTHSRETLAFSSQLVYYIPPGCEPAQFLRQPLKKVSLRVPPVAFVFIYRYSLYRPIPYQRTQVCTLESLRGKMKEDRC